MTASPQHCILPLHPRLSLGKGVDETENVGVCLLLWSVKHQFLISLLKNKSAPSLDAGSGQGVVVSGYGATFKKHIARDFLEAH